MCFIGVKPPHQQDPKSVFKSWFGTQSPLAAILMIFWVVLECSAKFGPNCQRFHEMTAILNKRITYLHFSPSLFCLFQLYLVRTLLGVEVANLTSNDFDLGKLRPFLGSEITFFALLSKSIVVIPLKLSRDIAGGREHLVCEIDLKLPGPQEMAAILRV